MLIPRTPHRLRMLPDDLLRDARLLHALLHERLKYTVPSRYTARDAVIEEARPRLLRLRTFGYPDPAPVLRVVEAAPGALADLLQASVWQLDFEGVTLETITDAVATFMDRAELLVTRMTKSGVREFDVRQAVLASDVVLVRAGDADGRDLVRWTMTIQHTTPAVRPIDVMTGLTELTGLQVPRSPLMTRLAQGVLEADGRVSDPFDA